MVDLKLSMERSPTRLTIGTPAIFNIHKWCRRDQGNVRGHVCKFADDTNILRKASDSKDSNNQWLNSSSSIFVY